MRDRRSSITRDSFELRSLEFFHPELGFDLDNFLSPFDYFVNEAVLSLCGRWKMAAEQEVVEGDRRFRNRRARSSDRSRIRLGDYFALGHPRESG